MSETTAFDPAPKRLDEVVRPEWLSQMLAARWPGARVVAVSTVETLITMATKVRLKLEIEGNDTAPTELCIKGVLTETGAHPSASITETLFYREAAATAGVRVPGCVHASLNAAGDNGVIVMNDMVAAGGRFCSALEPFTPDAARDGLEELAKLHVWGAAGTAFHETAWTPRFLDMITTRPIVPLDVLQEMLDGERGVPLPPPIRSAARLQRGLEALAAQGRARPGCLVHGDAHAGNVYRDARGRLGIVDWQVLQKGEWAQDVAYHLAAVLTPEDRRAHERALLDHYRERLRALGGPVLEAEEAWTRYRAAMIYGYYMWAITRKVDPPIIHAFVRRLGLAVSDLDSFAAVDA